MEEANEEIVRDIWDLNAIRYLDQKEEKELLYQQPKPQLTAMVGRECGEHATAPSAFSLGFAAGISLEKNLKL